MIITLTTDFGLADAYVGLMKGVILAIAPQARIVDLSHGVPPQDVLAGAMMIEAGVGYFPKGTIHVGVVDPGVGGERAAVAVATVNGFYIGPDNGLFTLALRREPMRAGVRLDNPAYHLADVSATFHGRDIFAPVAAHLAMGVAIDQLGTPVHSLKQLDVPEPVTRDDGALELRVLRIDGFGNLITNLRRERYDDWCRACGTCDGDVAIAIGAQSIRGISATFGNVRPGEPVAYFGSVGRLEIAVRNASARETLGVRAGDVLAIGPA